MSGGALDYAFQRLTYVLEEESWADFEREYPLAAAQVRGNLEQLAGQLRAIEWHLSGDGSWPYGATEPEVLDFLAGIRGPYDWPKRKPPNLAP